MLKKFRHKGIIALAAVMFIVYLLTLSISLDDMDSVNFALATEEFDISKDQPQAPGHPGYVFIAKLFNIVFGDHLLALTVQSAVFGALSIVAFYFLTKEMFNMRAALLSSALLAFTPIFWLSSVKAMSDMTSLFFLILSMLFIYRYIKYGKAKDLYIGSAVTGISIGIRFPLTAIILVPMLAYSYLANAHSQKKMIAVSTAILLLAAALWLVPTILINGAGAYFENSGWMIVDYRLGKPEVSMIGAEITGSYLVSRLGSFGSGLLSGGYGIIPENPGILGWAMIAMLALTAVIMAFSAKIRDSRLHFFAIGLVPYLAAVILFLPPAEARHLLPVIPALSAAFVLAIGRLKKLRIITFSALMIITFLISLPLAVMVHTEKSPPVQMIEYIKENYDLEKTMAVVSGSPLRHFEYYGAGIQFTDSISDRQAQTFLQGGGTLLSTDKERFSNRAAFNVSPAKEFRRDVRVHPKHSEEYLYEVSLT